MAIAITRTAAEELSDVERALRTARGEFRNWAAHSERMLRHPEDAPAIALQVRRSARIVESLLDEAQVHTMAARMVADTDQRPQAVSAGQ